MGQGMRVTVDAAMRARDVSRIRPQDETPQPTPPAAQAAAQPARVRRAERRRLAKRQAGQT
jgi:hypothetical protein